MTARRREPRSLTAEDADLWTRAMKDAKPLRKRVPMPAPLKSPAKKPAVSSIRAQTESPPPKGPLGIDGALEKRLRRGAVEIDATLDLHGLTQTSAYDRLVRFLGVAEATGRRRILVVTGKGAPQDETGSDTDWRNAPRGVLRRMLPEWLKEPPLNDKVLAFRPAHRRHGGAGAFYVILRRPRAGAEP